MFSKSNSHLLREFTCQGKTFVIALRDPRLPIIVRLLMWCAVAYLICPLDFKPDFLPGGLSDDSLITPMLISLGLLTIPASIFKDARRIANGATCSLVCVALSGSIFSMPNESSSVVPEAASSVQELVQNFISNPVRVEPETDAVLYCNDSSEEPDDWVMESGGKHKQKPSLAIIEKTDFESLVIRDVLPSSTQVSAVPIDRWVCFHGHQLKLYCTGDDSDSSAIDNKFSQSFGPPSMQKGGLFSARIPGSTS